MQKTSGASRLNARLKALRRFRLRAPLPKRTKLTLPDEPLPLSDDVLKSLRKTTLAMGKRSTERLVSDLFERIVGDDLYKTVLDEEMA